MALYRFFTGTAVSEKIQKHAVFLKQNEPGKNQTMLVLPFRKNDIKLVRFFTKYSRFQKKQRVFEFLLKWLYQ